MAMTIRGHKISVSTFTNKKAANAYGALAFIYTINNNSFYGSPNTLSASNMTLAAKAQAFFVGIPFYRLTGSNILCTGIPNGVPPPGTVTFTLSKATNNVFWLGLTLAIYGAVGKHFGLPFSTQAFNVGVPIAAGAFVGGGFDPDPSNATPTSGLPSVMSVPLISAAPGAGQPAQGSFSDSVRA